MAFNRPVHFEIPAEDPERAGRFYTDVFGWDVKKWDSPVMEYWIVMTGTAEAGEKWAGIDGGIVRRRGASPVEGQAVNAFVNTITVSSFDEIATRILSAGGSVAVPKAALAEMGWLGYFKDSEGNIFGILEEKKP